MLRAALLAITLGLLSWHTASAQEALLDLSVEHDTGKVFVHFEQLPAEFLYVAALQSGAGSNDLGFDRGQMDRTRLVRFERYGNRILLIEPNLAFRALSDNPAEKRAVTEAFAQSVLAGFDPEEETGRGATIDITPLLLSDIMRLAGRISELEQGEFSIDPGRSAVHTAGVKNFPDNTLLPTLITLQGNHPGAFISAVTPTPDSLSLRVTHQFVRLPDDGYAPRAFHPRSGYFPLQFRDYAAALDEPMDRRLVYRHRLRPGETLRYYVDGGTPEPVRSALLEGASWWAVAFEEAGFRAGFEVDVLPPDADPLDVRYNAIQWVHRSTRGWSYGGSVADPRTGEIIKGHVSLGSLRVRQNQLIAEALTAPFTGSDGSAQAAQDMALARLRQLSAHEVGHTLGIDHNFAASFSGDASVMDYPHPNLSLDDSGTVRIDQAYASGVSPWDRLVVRYGYAIFPPQQEQQALAAVIAEAGQKGLAFLGDQDARIPGSAHPGAHLWDNGSDVLARLDELLAIRRIGLANFSAAVIPQGTPLYELERRLVPVYLLHRYQLEAAGKLLGGLQYEYSLHGDGDPRLTPVDAATQQQALRSMLALLAPDHLGLPSTLHRLIPPPVLGEQRDAEFFQGQTGAPFDHLAPARAAADLVLRELLQAQRLARLNDQHALNPALPGHREVLKRLLDATWVRQPGGSPYEQAIRAETQWLVLRRLMKLATDNSASDVIRASATGSLVRLGDRLASRAYRDNDMAAAARREILNFLQRPPAEAPAAIDPAPPGSPIG